jgi:hypothetical protein
MLMNTAFFGFDHIHLRGETAMHLAAPRSARHAALLVLAGRSPLRPRALPGTPIAALPGASNCGF